MKKIITIVLIVGGISLVGIASVKAYAHHNNDYNCSNCYDNNLTNSVQKDDKGKFIENETTSIKIDLKMLDTDKTYDMETLYSGGMDKFAKYYNNIKFKCTKIEYHKKTQKVKYMLIEQITE